jgi:hypothetical protein
MCPGFTNRARSGLRLTCVTRLLGILVCASALAQAPVVGDIEFYGLNSLTPERILGPIHLGTGDPIPPSKGALEDRISEIPGVVLARVEAVCCQGRRTILFIGIEEKGAPHPAFRSPPAGEATLPPDVVDAYHEFLGAVAHAAGQGRAAEDLTAGHSRMDDAAARAIQDRFLAFAAGHVDLLRNVLRNGSEDEQRATAAVVIGYVPNKQAVVDDLQYALQDPDDAVRANAARALNAFAVAGIKVSPTWLLELLNSVVLSDRVEAVRTLLTLTDKPAPDVIAQLREHGLPAVVEMARWKTPTYALPPFLLVARVAGLTDQQAQTSWQKGDRETVIAKVVGGPLRKR